MEPKQKEQQAQLLAITLTLLQVTWTFWISTRNLKVIILLMDNAPINMVESIEKYVVICCYGYVYLPLYSSKLNPIEQF